MTVPSNSNSSSSNSSSNNNNNNNNSKKHRRNQNLAPRGNMLLLLQQRQPQMIEQRGSGRCEKRVQDGRKMNGQRWKSPWRSSIECTKMCASQTYDTLFPRGRSNAQLQCCRLLLDSAPRLPPHVHNTRTQICMSRKHSCAHVLLKHPLG